MIAHEKDRRTWRYRQSEAQIFANPESVPDGQGWVDCPSKVGAVAQAAPTEESKRLARKVKAPEA